MTYFPETLHSYQVHTGNELALMLEGGKPMAVFCRRSDEYIDEFCGQDFRPFLHSGEMNKIRFFVLDRDSGKNIIYTMIALKGQEWRMQLYRHLKLSLESSGWSNDKETMEGLLLGYTLEQNVEHQKLFSKWWAKN